MKEEKRKKRKGNERICRTDKTLDYRSRICRNHHSAGATKGYNDVFLRSQKKEKKRGNKRKRSNVKDM